MSNFITSYVAPVVLILLIFYGYIVTDRALKALSFGIVALVAAFKLWS